MDCSTPAFPVLRFLLEFAQTHAHWVSDAIQPSHPLLPHPQAFPASGSFTMSQFFASSGQIIGASASVSVLPMNIQHWYSLGLTGRDLKFLDQPWGRVLAASLFPELPRALCGFWDCCRAPCLGRGLIRVWVCLCVCVIVSREYMLLGSSSRHKKIWSDRH